MISGARFFTVVALAALAGLGIAAVFSPEAGIMAFIPIAAVLLFAVVLVGRGTPAERTHEPGGSHLIPVVHGARRRFIDLHEVNRLRAAKGYQPIDRQRIASVIAARPAPDQQQAVSDGTPFFDFLVSYLTDFPMPSGAGLMGYLLSPNGPSARADDNAWPSAGSGPDYAPSQQPDQGYAPFQSSPGDVRRPDGDDFLHVLDPVPASEEPAAREPEPRDEPQQAQPDAPDDKAPDAGNNEAGNDTPADNSSNDTDTGGGGGDSGSSSSDP